MWHVAQKHVYHIIKHRSQGSWPKTCTNRFHDIINCATVCSSSFSQHDAIATHMAMLLVPQDFVKRIYEKNQWYPFYSLKKLLLWGYQVDMAISTLKPPVTRRQCFKVEMWLSVMLVPLSGCRVLGGKSIKNQIRKKNPRKIWKKSS